MTFAAAGISGSDAVSAVEVPVSATGADSQCTGMAGQTASANQSRKVSMQGLDWHVSIKACPCSSITNSAACL